MDLGIAGRKAIVCASSRGLGYACAKYLAEAGCEVVINGRNEESLTAAAAALNRRQDHCGHGRRRLAQRAKGLVRRLPRA
jgi:NAD(P)-dependent dehydrogenase (short-subunit alcohol dehydrogenase family)